MAKRADASGQMNPKHPPDPPMTLGKTRLCLAVLAGVSLVVTGCTNADLERLRGRTPDQVKRACDPQRQTPEECSRTLDK
jgi:hypothetical protein